MSTAQRIRRRRRAGRGVALIVVMWVVLIAGVIMLGMLKAARVNHATAHSELSIVKAHWLARAGIECAIAVLADDLTDVDSTGDYWYDDEFSFAEIDLGDGHTFDVLAPADSQGDPTRVRFGMVDAASRINLNTADAHQLGVVPELTEQQIEAILDWRDQDNQPRPGGAELAYYQKLDFPYEIRNGVFQTPREVLLVRGVDPLAFFGEDANLNGVLDKNEDDGDDHRPEDNSDGQLQLGLAGMTTIYSFELNKAADGTDRVNVNDADEQTLASELDLTDGLASAIVTRRGNQNFTKLMDLLDVPAGQGGSEGNSGGTSGGGGGEAKTNEITLTWLAQHLDELTLTDDERLAGKINVNTASAQVLLALPEMDRETAGAIVNYRDSERGEFYTVGELLLSQTVTEAQFKALAELVTVRSNVFEIRSRGRTPWGVEQTIVAVVDRTGDSIRILYWYQSE